jgi:hypothetical protein
MSATKYWRVVAIACVGLVLVVTGLSLAILSNPNRFSLDIADDRNIQLFAISGFACTFVGIGLFMLAVRHTTKAMPVQLQRNANIGVGLGFVLQLGGSFLPEVVDVPIEIGMAFTLAGVPAFVWGAIHYAQGKKHSSWFGLLGVLGILGFIVLILLPPQESEPLSDAACQGDSVKLP